MKSQKFFTNIVSNLVIVMLILSVFSVTYGGISTIYTSTDSCSAIYYGNTNNKNVSLMINVYWGTEYIEPMLDILEAQDIQATFFVGGSWANSNPEILQQIATKGYEIGNHGYYHKDHDQISKERNYEEINITHQLIKGLTGYDMNLFAPPSGAFNLITLETAEELNYKTIMWSKDTIDWRDKNTTTIYNRATNSPKNGDLILMHPTKCTLNALNDIINFYKDNSFNLVTVTENIA